MSGSVIANGVELQVSVTYDTARQKYRLESPSLDRLYANAAGGGKLGLVDYLNREQSFRIVPRSSRLIYVLGHFYRPTFGVGADFSADDSEISKILIPSPVLEEVSSEKGDASGWGEDSLFGIIDRLGHPAGVQDYFGDPDVLVCDDMLTEVADFVFADRRRNRVAFIHAKASRSKHPYSATALQEVCSQAVKNINYLGMFVSDDPPRLVDWDGPWPDRNNIIVDRRIRRGPPGGDQAWQSIKSVIRHPHADRQVWLFLGRTLSKSQLEQRLGLPNPTPEAVQAAFLLHSTMTSVASVGAKLMVFCYP